MNKFLFLSLAFLFSSCSLFGCKKCYKEIHRLKVLVDREIAKIEKKKFVSEKAAMGYVQYLGISQGLEYSEHMIVYYHKHVERKHKRKHRKKHKNFSLQQSMEIAKRRMKPFSPTILRTEP